MIPESERRVLVVDDDVDFATTVAGIVELESCAVRPVFGAEEAIETARTFLPQVALIDIRLNRANGVGLVSRLREEHPDLVCVMMTAYADTDSAIQALKYGAYDYLRKPIRGGEITTALSRCFQHIELGRAKAEAERVLAESEAKYRLMAETAMDAIVTADGAGMALYANPCAELIFGYTPQEITGHPFARLLTPASAARHAELLGEILQQDGAQRAARGFELEGLRKDGAVIPLEISIGAMKAPSGNQLITYVLRDVSARRQAEESARVQREQLMQAGKMASLGTLVAGVAHEINNPNFVIMTSAEALTGIWESLRGVLDRYRDTEGDFDVDGQPYSKARGAIEEILTMLNDGARRIKRIVQDLRDFARQDPGAMEEHVSVNAVVESSIRLVSSLIRRSTHNFSVSYADSAPWVAGNRQRLEQVVVNLLQNGCQALTQMDNPLEVRIFRAPESHRIVIEVRDGGCGIAPDDLPRICDPFFSTKREYGGTGLGLSVSSSIVKQHGGELTFESHLGRGTVARILLPELETDPQKTPPS